MMMGTRRALASAGTLTVVAILRWAAAKPHRRCWPGSYIAPDAGFYVIEVNLSAPQRKGICCSRRTSKTSAEPDAANRLPI